MRHCETVSKWSTCVSLNVRCLDFNLHEELCSRIGNVSRSILPVWGIVFLWQSLKCTFNGIAVSHTEPTLCKHKLADRVKSFKLFPSRVNIRTILWIIPTKLMLMMLASFGCIFLFVGLIFKVMLHWYYPHMVRIWHVVNENRLPHHIPVNPLNINTHYASEHDARWRQKEVNYSCVALILSLCWLFYLLQSLHSYRIFFIVCWMGGSGVAVGSNKMLTPYTLCICPFSIKYALV